MLGLETQYQLRDFLRVVAERELQIEGQRQLLGAIHDFEPYAAFCRVNRHDDKRITADEIFNFLNQNGICHLSERDCGRVISYFDSDEDNGLNYKEWMEVLLPCDDLYMRSVITQRPNYDCPPHQNLRSEVERQIANLIKLEIEYHIYIEGVKNSMVRSFDWSNMRAFQTIDNRSEGFLDFSNIMNFCRRSNFYASESDVIAIVRRLDEDADQRITFQEWDEYMSDQEDLAPATHGDPNSDNREDPYFRQTSPVKTYQTRTPRKTAGGQSAYSGSPRHSMAQSASHVQISITNCEAQNTGRDSPLRRNSPVARESARASPMQSQSYAHSCHQQQQQEQGHQSQRQQSPGGNELGPKHWGAERIDSLDRVYCDPPFRANSPMRYRGGDASQGSSFVRQEQSGYQQQAATQRSHQQHEASASALSVRRECSSPLKSSFAANGTSNTYNGTASAQKLRGNDTSCAKNVQFQRNSGYGASTMCSSANQQQTQGYGSGMQHSASKQQLQASSSQQRATLRYAEEQELVAAFRELVRLETGVDEAKMRLSCQPDFNLMDAFNMLDKNGNGWVNANEITQVLGEMGSFPHKDEVYLFVRRYDRNGDSRITYNEFCDAFNPYDQYTKSQIERRPAYHTQNGYCRSNFFMPETRQLFLEAFRAHFSAEEQAEMLRKRLCHRPDFGVHEAFQTCDRDGNGCLTRSELTRTVAANGHFMSDKDLQMLMQRFDKNQNERITYTEFTEEMIPKCPYK